jgi:hypothetical protein
MIFKNETELKNLYFPLFQRALAAERRLLANASVTGLATPVLVRCFLCGLDISGKVPFEYNNNKFCSPPCLQKHRKLNVK